MPPAIHSRNQTFTSPTIHSPAPLLLLLPNIRRYFQFCVSQVPPGIHPRSQAFTSPKKMVEVSSDVRVARVPITEVGCTGPLYRPVTIGALPDDTLLEIFSFYVEEVYTAFETSEFVEVELVEQWYTLVHVCRRWRHVVFVSPCRLNLQLICSSKRPVRKMLDIWPAFPLIVDNWYVGSLDSEFGPRKTHIDNVVAALECRDRVRHISLGFLPDFLLKMFAAVMQESFLALTYLVLSSTFDSDSAHSTPALPDSFMGGSAPRLRSLTLERIPFPGLPTLLQTTNYLSELLLVGIPHSGYISPDAMINCLSSLTRLRNFRLEFNSPLSRPDRPSRHPPSVTRIDLPALLHFRFQGDNEYLEQFVAWFNAPLLKVIYITLFNRLLFDTSQLFGFIHRVENNKVIQKAAVRFSPDEASVALSPFENADVRTSLELRIKCTKSEWQLSSLADICSSSSSSYPFPLSSVERLDIFPRYTRPDVGQWHDDMEDTQWLEFLQPFTAVKDLYLCEGLALRVVHALQDLTGEGATEMLPALQSIFIEGHQLSEAIQTAIGPFIASRQLSSHPVAVHSETVVVGMNEDTSGFWYY
jgi:hypothetical protein